MIVYTTAAMAINSQISHCISSETMEEHKAFCARIGCNSLVLWKDGDPVDTWQGSLICRSPEPGYRSRIEQAWRSHIAGHNS